MQEVEVIGNLYPDNKHQSGNVYSVGGVAPTLMSGTHGYGIGAFIEARKVDMRNAEFTIPESRAEQSRAA